MSRLPWVLQPLVGKPQPVTASKLPLKLAAFISNGACDQNHFILVSVAPTKLVFRAWLTSARVVLIQASFGRDKLTALMRSDWHSTRTINTTRSINMCHCESFISYMTLLRLVSRRAISHSTRRRHANRRFLETRLASYRNLAAALRRLSSSRLALILPGAVDDHNFIVQVLERRLRISYVSP
jgi:hypothetical protein